MNILFRLFWASLVIVFSFFFVLHLPWGLLPFSDAVNVILVGSVLLALAAYYTYYHYRLEGWDFGWFLSKRAGLWVIGITVIGLVMVGCGFVLYAAPEIFLPAFEQGALPFGIALVSSFWLSLIFIFGLLSVKMLIYTLALLRVRRATEAAVNVLIVLVCVALTALFVWLFLEVLNDIAIRIAEENRSRATWLAVGAIVLMGLVASAVADPKKLLDTDKE